MKQDRLLCAAAFRLNVPPTFDKYMEWGFFDGSVRFYAADSRKVGRPISLYLSNEVILTGCSCLGILSIYTLANCPALFLRIRKH